MSRLVSERPLATYRLQLNKAFTFRDAEAIVPYLAALGISHVYASPILAARTDSVHGYDVVDHSRINPELGGEDAFEAFSAALARHGLGMILDVVPNHMCIATSENRWWNDVLQNGPSSPFSVFFDIDWSPPKPDLSEKVLLPVLGDQFGKVLENQEIRVEYDAGAFNARYYESCFPIAPGTVPAILEPVVEPVRAQLGSDHGHLLELESIITACTHLPRRSETTPDKIRERQREKEIIRRRLKDLVETSDIVRAELDRTLRDLNGRRGSPRSFDRLEALLGNQAYRLSHWRVAAEEINYRRFFDINDLAAIRIEEPVVLESVHSKAFELLRAGKVHGLRIDHVDGLRDPEQYLADLQTAGAAPYVLVEKILTGDESLPPWPIAGTTGYEFLNVVNGVFVDQRAARTFERIYARVRGAREGRGRGATAAAFEDLVYEAKRLILRTSMSSELFVLANRLDRISERHRWSRDFTRNTLHHALGEVIACFPVYRTYTQESSRDIALGDRKHVLAALAAAKRRNRSMSASIFDFIGDILLLRDPDGAQADEIAERRELVMRFQQLTGPVMAKGLEDTVFYRYFPLASLAEVGGRPNAFGLSLERFHEWNRQRRASWPLALSASATHDTKRGEDVRMRLDVLSEMPREWETEIRRWTRLLRRARVLVDEQRIPGDNELYLFFQTALGVWPLVPMTPDDQRQLVDRIAAYMLKAAREAKVHTSWVNTNEAYEAALDGFVRRALAPDPENAFVAELAAFAARLGPVGELGSLGQVAIKSTAPGVPDFYQGTELWDLSLVDPDNRRPVDYARRQRALRALQRGHDGPSFGAGSEPDADGAGTGAAAREGLVRDCLLRRDEGILKLHVAHRCLDLRRRRPAIFLEGTYLPLFAAEPLRRHVVAFARQRDGESVITVTGRFLTQVPGALPPGTGESAAAWGQTELALPGDVMYRTLEDIFTGRRFTVSQAGALPLAELFAVMPVAVLETVA